MTSCQGLLTHTIRSSTEIFNNKQKKRLRFTLYHIFFDGFDKNSFDRITWGNKLKLCFGVFYYVSITSMIYAHKQKWIKQTSIDWQLLPNHFAYEIHRCSISSQSFYFIEIYAHIHWFSKKYKSIRIKANNCKKQKKTKFNIVLNITNKQNQHNSTKLSKKINNSIQTKKFKTNNKQNKKQWQNH